MATLGELADPDYRVRRGPECSVKILLDKMDKEEAKLLHKALANVQAPSTRITIALRDLGHQISSDSVQRHRRRDCRCTE